MTVQKRTASFVVCALVLAVSAVIGAWQNPSAATAPLTQQIPTDPLITTGKFANGLRYYVRANKKPENRAELRLVVNAGSLLEEDDQQGLAHFVEHMAFNGTKHFPKMDVVNFMQSIGMHFGAHVNAYTSFDETVFMLQVPTDKSDVLDRSMLILEDWAHGVSFDDAEIDKERGVVMEEWRLGRGAGTRMQDKQFPILLKGSRYADRLPIGKPEILQSFKHDRLRKFYSDWYRPDLMAVIAVGDFDKTAIEGLIKQHFGSIPAATAPKARPTFDVPDQPGTAYAIATDKEATNTTVSVYAKQAIKDPTTVGAYRQQIVEGLFGGLLSGRFGEMAQKPDAPFIAAGAESGLLVRTKEARMLNALVKEDGVDKGLEALFTESDRVTRFGFTTTEIDRQKRALLRSLEQAVAEKDKQESSGYAAEYARNFLQREPIPGIVYENDLYQRFIPEITPAEINALAAGWSPDRNRVVLLSAPEKPGLVVPDAAKLAAVIKGAATKATAAYVDTVDSSPLIGSAPTPGTVVKTSTRDAIGITEWELSNGVKVVLKPTTFKEDEILVRASSFGGTSLAADKDFVSADSSTAVVPYGGLGKFSAIDLQKMLAGKVAAVAPFVDEITQGLNGRASKKDLETLFQLIYLTFTAPRADPTIFGVITNQAKAMLANQRAMPEVVFQETVDTTMAQNHFRARPMAPELVNEMNLDASMAFYKERFADASGFRFVFVGSVDPEVIKPLAEKYLASLPSTHKNEMWKDVGMRFPKGVIEKRVEKGIEPKSQTTMVFSGPFQFDQVHRVAIRAMAALLERRLRETLREDLGGTYSVGVSPAYWKVPNPRYRLDIDFGSAPDRADQLAKTVLQEIQKLTETGPTEKELADTREGLLRDFETNSKQNSYLLTQIVFKYEVGEELADVFAMQRFYTALTPADIQAAAKTYLDFANYVRVVLVPEKK
jgi:zinc protease